MKRTQVNIRVTDDELDKLRISAAIAGVASVPQLLRKLATPLMAGAAKTRGEAAKELREASK